MSFSSQHAPLVTWPWAAIAVAVLACGPTTYGQILTMPGEYAADAYGDPDTRIRPQFDNGPDGFAAPEIYGEYVEGGPPAGHAGGGSFFSPALNAHLRARYSTQSYGQGEGNFDLGTMRLFDLGDAVAFLDGQVTMNDVDGVGYNVGGGYRWLWDEPLPFVPDPMRIMGVSLWSDGSSTENDNFFTQLGISLELLGDQWDLRVNGYIPLGDQSEDGEFSPTGNAVFAGHGLGQQLAALRESALTVGEVELARRIGNRDAWVFGGAYTFAGTGFDHTTGARAGFRGYAFHDLFVQIAVTEDEVFDTNAVFSIIWFIGRTRSTDRLTGALTDRLREPVLRNDYVAVGQTTAFDSVPVTNDQGELFRFVHVDSSAPAGGNGTFENPFNDVSPVNFNSQDGDTILLHGGSQFTNTSITLRDNQQLLGEGGGRVFTVTTMELGTLNLPQTAPGASAQAIPTIQQNGGGTSVTLASNNTVDNLRIVGGANAINGTNETENPTLRNLEIANTIGDGIVLRAFARDDMDDLDMDGATTEIDFNVTIEEVQFESVGGHDIAINADAGVDTSLPTVDLNETINIRNITSTGGAGAGIQLSNTNTGGVATILDSSFSGNASGVVVANGAGSVDINNVDVTNASGPGMAIALAPGAAALDFRLRNSDISAGGDSAFVFSSNHTNSNDVRFQLANNSFTNSSNVNPTVDIDANGTEVLNSTVETNTLVNNGTAVEYAMDANGALGGIRLRLKGNIADGGAGVFELTENGGGFTVEDQFTVGADNTGTVNQNGAVGIDGGNIPLPFPGVP